MQTWPGMSRREKKKCVCKLFFFSRSILYSISLTMSFSPYSNHFRCSWHIHRNASVTDNSKPVKRIMSTISKHSEEAEDDEICSGNLWIINEPFSEGWAEQSQKNRFKCALSTLFRLLHFVCLYIIYIYMCVLVWLSYCYPSCKFFLKAYTMFPSLIEIIVLFSWKTVILGIWLIKREREKRVCLCKIRNVLISQSHLITRAYAKSTNPCEQTLQLNIKRMYSFYFVETSSHTLMLTLMLGFMQIEWILSNDIYKNA